MTIIALYLLAGALLAHRRASDIAAEGGDRVLTAARWMVTWPFWVGRS
jgi:hypothetical protein